MLMADMSRTDAHETVHLRVHRRQVHKAEEDAHVNAENDSEPPVVALLLLEEEPDHDIEIGVKSSEPHINRKEPRVNSSKPVVNMTNLGEEGTRDTLHVGHRFEVDSKTTRLIYIITEYYTRMN